MTHIKRETPTDLYAITPDHFTTKQLITWTEILLAKGCRWFQLRRKTLSQKSLLHEAQVLQPFIQAQQGHLIINDHYEIAIETNAHGVHLGAQDLSVSELRRRYPHHSLMVGVSCYQSLDLAMKAQMDGADYVAFGSVFSSSTKPLAPKAPLTLFEEARSVLKIPCIAIGGITPQNARPLINSGASALAVIQALADFSTLEQHAEFFYQLFTQARMSHEHAQ